MSRFQLRPDGTTPGLLDPSKHVNYVTGMVLGVDDFFQEFAYLTGRNANLARRLHGYGTVSGLRVLQENVDPKGPRVVVRTGQAYTPRGQLVRVPRDQCAYLADWLNDPAHKSLLPPQLGTPAVPRITLHVVLGYRDFPTDAVPIPGEPCRGEDQVLQSSRLADDFALELRVAPPDQTEALSIRDFIGWLDKLKVGGPSIAPNLFEDAIRNAAVKPPAPTDKGFMLLAGASDPTTVSVLEADFPKYLRAALRVYVTDLRPIWLATNTATDPDRPDDEAVLLGHVDLPVKSDPVKGFTIPPPANVIDLNDPNQIKIDEEDRPVLLGSRMLQELQFATFTRKP